MSSAFLDFIMRAVLAELEIVSTVAASNPGKGGKGSKPEAREPAWGDAPVPRLRRKYAACDTEERKRAVIDEALETLREIRFSKGSASILDLGTKDGRRKLLKDDRPVSVLARAYGYSEGHIYHLLRLARRDG